MLEPSESSSEFAPCWREASVAGNRVRLTAQLISAADGQQSLVADLRAHLGGCVRCSGRAGSCHRGESDPESRRSLERPAGPAADRQCGRLHALSPRAAARSLASLEGFQTAVDCFAQAVAMDPEYAVAAWLGYAMRCSVSMSSGSCHRPAPWRAQERRPIGRSSWTSKLGDGHLREPCAPCSMSDWTPREEFERAMNAVPVPVLVQHWYALFPGAVAVPTRPCRSRGGRIPWTRSR